MNSKKQEKELIKQGQRHDPNTNTHMQTYSGHYEYNDLKGKEIF